MKKTIKLLSVSFLLFALVFNISFATSSTTTRSEATEQGEVMGRSDGERAGQSDYLDGKVNNYAQSIPTSQQIIRKYNLNKDSTLYRSEFLSAYTKAFKEAYRSTFRKANIESASTPAESGKKNGEALGSAEGIHAANIDILNDFSSDWMRGYTRFLSGTSLRNKYKLEKKSSRYEEFFEASFQSAFKKAYTAHYQDYSNTFDINNTNYQLVTYFDDTIIYDKPISSVIKASELETQKNTAWMQFNKGTVYQDTYISLYRARKDFSLNSGSYESVSDIYNVSVQNDRGRIKFYKPAQLHFVFSDNSRIGIYKWVSNRWIYMPTYRDEKSIYLKIPEGEYAGGKYALFIDNMYKVPTDIAFNWAYQDIIVAIRRGYVFNNTTFRPNAAISRAELADLIYRSMAYRTQMPNKNISISDSANLGSYAQQVKYAINMNFMTLDKNNAFNPHQYVSYTEFEKIMSNVSLRPFKFTEIAQKMYHHRYSVSKYLTNPKLNVTRSEAVFTFNEVIK